MHDYIYLSHIRVLIMAFTQKDKVEFLKSAYPDIKNIDFITQNSMFLNAKRKLIDAGFYKVRGINEVSDAAVHNLLLLAKGFEPYKLKLSKTRMKIK